MYCSRTIVRGQRYTNYCPWTTVHELLSVDNGTRTIVRGLRYMNYGPYTMVHELYTSFSHNCCSGSDLKLPGSCQILHPFERLIFLQRNTRTSKHGQVRHLVTKLNGRENLKRMPTFRPASTGLDHALVACDLSQINNHWFVRILFKTFRSKVTLIFTITLIIGAIS